LMLLHLRLMLLHLRLVLMFHEHLLWHLLLYDPVLHHRRLADAVLLHTLCYLRSAAILRLHRDRNGDLSNLCLGVRQISI